MAVLVTWLSNSKSHMRSRGILVTFSENGGQHGFVSHNSAVPLERFDQTFTFRIAPVLKHVHSSRTQLFKAILSRTSCAVTLMSHDNAGVSKATQEFTPFRCHISLCKQNCHIPHAYLQMVRTHNKLAAAERKWKMERSTIKQERAFWANRWSFAKSVIEGSQTNTKPSFSSTEAFAYFSNSFAKPADGTYARLPYWVEEVMPANREEDEFDTTPITADMIWRALKKSNKSSSPGDNGLTYHHLWKLPSTHGFLAILFNTIIESRQPPPSNWSSARIRLICKGSDVSSPGNFRPIALSSCVGKLLNKIIATRMERFLLQNGIINPSTQKGFLRNMTGVIEHIHALNAILDQARELRLPLSITFLDLKNAFGSVPHDLITDMFQLVGIPDKISNYIQHCYRSMTVYIQSEEWSTPSLPITQGVFQGDTLSPMIFLLAFSPIIHLAESWEYAVFLLRFLFPTQKCFHQLANLSMSSGMRKNLRSQLAGTRPQWRNTTVMVRSCCSIHVVPKKW